MNDHLPERPLLGVLLRLLSQHYSHDVHEAMRAHGFGDIRPSHSNVFLFARSDGIAITELARLARVRRQSMAQAVQELISAGYAELRDNPAPAENLIRPSGSRCAGPPRHDGRSCSCDWLT
jgi:hypothetical protein